MVNIAIENKKLKIRYIQNEKQLKKVETENKKLKIMYVQHNNQIKKLELTMRLEKRKLTRKDKENRLLKSHVQQLESQIRNHI